MPIDEFLPLLKSAEHSLQQVSKELLKRIKPLAGPYAIFHHQSHAVERIHDISTILKRLFHNSDCLIQLSWQIQRKRQRNATDQDLQRLYREDNELTHQMKLDFESLYIFGTILLDQWAFLVAYMLSIPDPEKISFHKLVEKYEDEEERGIQNELWVKHHQDMLWLTHQLRFYRNRFIIHADRPWQRGCTRTTFGEGFNLFTPSPPGWLDEAKVQKQIEDLSQLIKTPVGGQDLLGYLFMNIGKIEKRRDRENVARLVQQTGLSTPDFTVLAHNLLKFISEGTAFVTSTALANIKQVVLGGPKSRKNGKMEAS